MKNTIYSLLCIVTYNLKNIWTLNIECEYSLFNFALPFSTLFRDQSLCMSMHRTTIKTVITADLFQPLKSIKKINYSVKVKKLTFHLKQWI